MHRQLISVEACRAHSRTCIRMGIRKHVMMKDGKIYKNTVN